MSTLRDWRRCDEVCGDVPMRERGKCKDVGQEVGKRAKKMRVHSPYRECKEICLCTYLWAKAVLRLVSPIRRCTPFRSTTL